MNFYYVYKALAHPETNDYVAPFTLQERLMHVAEAKTKLGTRIPWLCDSMANDMKHAFGDRPNSEFIVDPDGKIVVARQWSDPVALREDLANLVGPSEHTTRIVDLGMKSVEPAHAAPKGVVPRLQLPSGMVTLIVEPLIESGAEPFYVKLRAEAEPSVLSRGDGKLYLGFMLDPLYHVHWNNEAMPVIFEVIDANGIVVSQDYGEAPEVQVAADADPREFLLDVCGYLSDPASRYRGQLTVKVKYFACDDAQTFCKPVTQTYVVTLQRDRDGGQRRAGTQRGTRSAQPGSSNPRDTIAQRRMDQIPSSPDLPLISPGAQRRRQMMQQMRRNPAQRQR